MSNGSIPSPSPTVGRVSKKDADYVFGELTRSICPKCRRVIDAKIVLRDNKVFMVKRCPDANEVIWSLLVTRRLPGQSGEQK